MDDGERRRAAALMLASARGTAAGSGRTVPRSGRGGKRDVPARARLAPRKRCSDLARHALPALMELPEKVGFRVAFCAAVAVWGAAFVTCLGSLGGIGW